jgi:hypothetical protein
MLLLCTALAFAAPLIAQEGGNPSGGTTDIDVDIGSDAGDGWAVGPTWLIIGGIALVVIILAIALGSRGAGPSTTIVRD